MLKSRFADKYVAGQDTPPPPPLPPPVRATAQSRIAFNTVERDCSAADMLLAPGKTSNVGEDEKSPIRLYGLATQLPNTKLSNDLQHDVILPMLAPLTDVFRCTWGARVAPDGAPGRSCLQDKVQVDCNHSSEVRPATCAGLLEGQGYFLRGSCRRGLLQPSPQMASGSVGLAHGRRIALPLTE